MEHPPYGKSNTAGDGRKAMNSFKSLQEGSRERGLGRGDGHILTTDMSYARAGLNCCFYAIVCGLLNTSSGHVA